MKRKFKGLYNKVINVAIDGPAGAGKSTISRLIAKELSFIYVDTGSLYRTIALFACNNDIGLDNIADITPLLKDIDIKIKYEGEMQQLYLNGENVTSLIRQPNIPMMASAVSAIPQVRDFLLDLQLDIAKNNNIIMDGRDIGTVILPNADVKIYLTASVEDRAKRRYDEHIAKGENVDFDELLTDIKKRDHADSNRAVAPLKQADDAIFVDTTGNELEKSVSIIKDIICERLDLA